MKKQPKWQKTYRKHHWNPDHQPTISGKLHRNQFAYFPDIRYVSQSQVKRHLLKMLDHLSPFGEEKPGVPLAIVDGLRGEVVALMFSPQDAWDMLHLEGAPYQFRAQSYEKNNAQLAVPVWDLEADEVTRTMGMGASDTSYYSLANRKRRRALMQLRSEKKRPSLDNSQRASNTGIMQNAANLPELFPTEDTFELLPDCPACVLENADKPLTDEEGNEVFHETNTKHHPTPVDVPATAEVVSEETIGVSAEEEASEPAEVTTDPTPEPDNGFDTQPEPEAEAEVDPRDEFPSVQNQSEPESNPEDEGITENDMEDVDEVSETSEEEAAELAAQDEVIAEVIARPICQIENFKPSTLCMKGENQNPGAAVAHIKIPEVNETTEADVCDYHFTVLGANFEVEVLERYEQPVPVSPAK